MAQFRGTLAGCRGETSRLGSKVSGLRASLNGWKIGVEVFLFHEAGRDYIRVVETGGSGGSAPRRTITTLSERIAVEGGIPIPSKNSP